MAKREVKRRGIKGTDVYLAIMLVGTVWFIWFAAEEYHRDSVWFPPEITIGWWILMLYEVFALLRVQLVKQGEPDQHGIIAGTYNKVKDWVNSKAPIELPDTEIDVEIAKKQVEDSQQDAQSSEVITEVVIEEEEDVQQINKP